LQLVSRDSVLERVWHEVRVAQRTLGAPPGERARSVSPGPGSDGADGDWGSPLGQERLLRTVAELREEALNLQMRVRDDNECMQGQTIELDAMRREVAETRRCALILTTATAAHNSC